MTSLLGSIKAIGQDLDLAGISYSFLPSSSISEDVPTNPEVKVQEFNIFFKLPKKLSEKTILLNGLDYTQVQPTIQNDINTNFNNENLHTINYTLALIKKLGNDWTGSFLLNPTLSSSFGSSLEGDDFIFNTSVLFKKQKSDNYSIGLGVLVTSNFGSPMALPAFTLTKKSQSSKFEVFLPQKISYERIINNLSLGIQLKIEGSRYNVSYASPVTTDPNGTIELIRYSRMHLGPMINYRLNKMLVLRALGGISANRTFELEDSSDQTIDYSLKEGAFVQFGIFLKPELDKNNPDG